MLKRPKKSESNQPEVDWTVVRTAYITGAMSTSELATMYGQTHSAVHTQCTRHGWAAERARLQKEASERALKIFTDKRDKAIEKLANQAAILTENVFAHISFILQDAAVKDANGRTIGTTLDAKEINQLASAIGQDLKAARLNLGISTDNQAQTEAPPAAPEIPFNDLDPMEASRQYQQLMERL